MKALRAAIEAMERQIPAALCTVTSVDGSAPRGRTARMLVFEDGEIVGTVGGGEWERRVILAAQESLADGAPRTYRVHLTRDLGMCCGGAMEAFIEPLASRDRIHVFGAGHVAGALAPLLQALEFEVSVYDDRDEWLNAERFPDCERVLGDPLRNMPSPGPQDYVLIVTHNHQLDQALLQALIDRPLRYLGMIGSRAKVAKFFVRLRAAGVDEALFKRVSAPVGLDIRAETPAEIAVSIAAELIRVRRGQAEAPISLSEKPLPARGGDGVAVPPGLSSEG
ncbi:MAG: xanthine dehydrogenase accessory protein XdhC [Alphaproteobacteria bacterium]|nr:xanthine dehydrogenase accessory protein XdhC [Alphaproteobacteria bacterium]